MKEPWEKLVDYSVGVAARNREEIEGMIVMSEILVRNREEFENREEGFEDIDIFEEDILRCCVVRVNFWGLYWRDGYFAGIFWLWPRRWKV